MKTKELIRLLQEADSSGELHVSMNGVVRDIYASPGYYDGGYLYAEFNEDGGIEKYVYSKHGDKVVIETIDYHDVIWDEFDRFAPYTYPKFNDVLNKFENIDSSGNKKGCTEEFTQKIRTTYDYAFNAIVGSDEEALATSLAREREGWVWIQSKSGDSLAYYLIEDENVDIKERKNDWTILNERGEKQGINALSVRPIQYSGLFIKIDSDVAEYPAENFYRWKKIKHV